MRASIRKRIGRGLAAISSTGSTKLTWLQTTMAGTRGGDVGVALDAEPVHGAREHEGDEAQQVLGHQAEDVARDDRVGDAGDQEHAADADAEVQQRAGDQRAADHEQRVEDVVGRDDAGAVAGQRAHLDQRVHRHAVEAGAERQHEQVDHRAARAGPGATKSARLHSARGGRRQVVARRSTGRSRRRSCRSRPAAPGRSRPGGATASRTAASRCPRPPRTAPAAATPRARRRAARPWRTTGTATGRWRRRTTSTRCPAASGTRRCRCAPACRLRSVSVTGFQLIFELRRRAAGEAGMAWAVSRPMTAIARQVPPASSGPMPGTTTSRPPASWPSRIATKVPISTMPLPPVISWSSRCCGR